MPDNLILTTLRRAGVQGERAEREPDVILVPGLGNMTASVTPAGEFLLTTTSSRRKGEMGASDQRIAGAPWADRRACEDLVDDGYSFLQ